MVSRLGLARVVRSLGVAGLAVYIGMFCGTWSVVGQYIPPSYVVRYVEQPPVIDGILTTSAEWAAAQPAEENWTLMRSGVNFANDLPDDTANRFVALWGDEGLYLQHQVDFGGWADLGYGRLDGAYENLNLYFDPNADWESNDQALPDGYRLSFNQPLGETDSLEVGWEVDAFADALFGGSLDGDSWSEFGGAQMKQTTSSVPEFGYTELFIPWSDFDATNPEQVENPATDEVGLYHPEAPLDGEEWFFNIARIETSGSLPTWAAAPGNTFFAQRPHGVLQFSKSSAILGDFDGDGMLTVIDINQLSAEVRHQTHASRFDLNQDALVTDLDREIWVEDLKYTYFGDANLDGQFDTSDFVDIFVAGEYEDGLIGNSVWETGDWDGNGEFDTSDFIVAFISGGFERGQKTSLAAVPEPSSGILLLLACLGLLVRRR